MLIKGAPWEISWPFTENRDFPGCQLCCHHRHIGIKILFFHKCITRLRFLLFAIGVLHASRCQHIREQGKSEGFDSCDRPSNLKLDSNRQFFRPCDRQIWWMTLQNNRAHLLCYFKLCASFRSHWWIQTWVTVRKRPIWVKFDDF